MSLDYPIGAQWRRGKDRVVYRPDWDSVTPFIVYRNGNARAHRGALMTAIAVLDGPKATLLDWERGV